MKSFKYWVLVYIYCFIIFFISGSSPPPQPGFAVTSMGIFKHIIEYLGLSFLVLIAFKNSKNFKNYSLYTIIFIVLFAISDEIHQLFVPGRYFSYIDILADSFGSFVIVSFRTLIKNGFW